MSSLSAHLEKKTVATLCKKETGTMQFVVDLQVLWFLERFSIQLFMAAPGKAKILICSNFVEGLLQHKLF
jgi:hypothetical protein